LKVLVRRKVGILPGKLGILVRAYNPAISPPGWRFQVGLDKKFMTVYINQ
jgi:hypothetical protein